MALIRLIYGDFFDKPFPQHPDSDFQGWLAGHQAFFDTLDEEILASIASGQVDHAVGTDLNEVGAIFGKLGKRRGRGDTSYTRFLKSVVNAYEGNGTLGAIRFAVATVLLSDEETVHIEEFYHDLEYTIRVTEWADHVIGEVWNLADIADPSTVKQRGLIYDCGSAVVDIAPEEATDGTTQYESPDAVIDIAPSGTAIDMDADRGFGTNLLDGQDTLGE